MVEIFTDFELVLVILRFFLCIAAVMATRRRRAGGGQPVARISFPGMKNGMKKSFFENIIYPLGLESEWKVLPT